MKTRRQVRYTKLRASGFIPREAQVLSRVPPKITPYFRMIVKEREAMWKRAQKLGTGRPKFEDQIKELYRVNRWMKRGRTGKPLLDPWQMLREVEDKFRAKFPQYESPWEKRQRSWRDFQTKIERTIAKQRGQA